MSNLLLVFAELRLQDFLFWTADAACKEITTDAYTDKAVSEWQERPHSRGQVWRQINGTLVVVMTIYAAAQEGPDLRSRGGR